MRIARSRAVESVEPGAGSSEFLKLPTKFKIFKVNTDSLNAHSEPVTYENDVARKTDEVRREDPA